MERSVRSQVPERILADRFEHGETRAAAGGVRWTRLWSSSAASASSTSDTASPHTARSASTVNPPTNKPRTANSRCWSGVSRFNDQSMVACRVRWRSGASRLPGPNGAANVRSRSRIWSGVSTRVRAAASSSASGRPARYRHSSATDSHTFLVSSKSGSAARARSMNSAVAGDSSSASIAGSASAAGTSRPCTEYTRSKATCSDARLVTSTSKCSHRPAARRLPGRRRGRARNCPAESSPLKP